MKLSTFLFFVLLSLTSLAKSNQFQFVIQSNGISNLIYQLDCMIGHYRCGEDSIQKHWQTKLGWTTEDDAMLERWKSLRFKYHGDLPLDIPAAKPFAMPWSGPQGMQIHEKFSIATFHARDRKELRKNLETVLEPTDFQELQMVLDHFEPRFNKWWSKEGLPAARKFSNSLQKTINQPKIFQMIEEFAHFYGAQLPQSYPLYLNLFLLPSRKEGNTYATVFENHAAIEFFPGEKIAHRLDVIIHEFCHFFFASATEEKKRTFIDAFASSSNPLSLPTLDLLDEALATALGNGLAAELLMEPVHYQERLNRERGFYNNLAIDQAAKSLMPTLKQMIAQKKTLHDKEFPNLAIETLSAKMTTVLKMPARLLTNTIFVFDSELDSFYQQKIRRKLNGGHYTKKDLANDDSWKMFSTYPKMSAVILVSPQNIKALEKRESLIQKKDLQEMKKKFKSQDSFVYAIQKYPSTFLFVIGGKSEADLDQAFSRLLEAPDQFTGLLN